MSDRGTSSGFVGGRAWWVALLALPLVEVTGHATIRARVPDHGDWERAAAHVRAEHREGDLVVAAPDWADPVLRWVAGDLLTLRDAGPSDLERYERLWVVSTRGGRSRWSPDRAADETVRVGRLLVERWDLGESNVVFDLVDEIANAHVEWIENGEARPCGWRRAAPSGGSLGAGALTPEERHVCPGARPWIWVGPTVTEDLDLQPRHCVWQHPTGVEPVRATLRDVPLGEALVFYGGLYYEHERMRQGGEIHARILVQGELVGQLIHRDGDGWKRVVIDPHGSPSTSQLERGDVTIEVTAPAPHLRTFCWSAQMLRARPGAR